MDPSMDHLHIKGTKEEKRKTQENGKTYADGISTWVAAFPFFALISNLNAFPLVCA